MPGPCDAEPVSRAAAGRRISDEAKRLLLGNVGVQDLGEEELVLATRAELGPDEADEEDDSAHAMCDELMHVWRNQHMT